MSSLKIKLATILCFMIYISSKFVFAAEKQVYQVSVETFLTSLIDGQIDAAYTKILQGSLIQEKGEEVKNLKQQTSVGLDIYGKPLGFELLKQQDYGASIARMVYVLKCEKHPLIWEFYFYKPKSEWTLVRIMFNDRFDLLADK